MDTKKIQQTIHFHNSTPHTVTVTVIVEADGKDNESHVFGPIGPQSTGETTLLVWWPGTFTINASWPREEGGTGAGRFTALLTPEQEPTALTLMMEPVFDDGLYGRFTNVLWARPEGDISQEERIAELSSMAVEFYRWFALPLQQFFKNQLHTNIQLRSSEQKVQTLSQFFENAEVGTDRFCSSLHIQGLDQLGAVLVQSSLIPRVFQEIQRNLQKVDLQRQGSSASRQYKIQDMIKNAETSFLKSGLELSKIPSHPMVDGFLEYWLTDICLRLQHELEKTKSIQIHHSKVSRNPSIPAAQNKDAQVLYAVFDIGNLWNPCGLMAIALPISLFERMFSPREPIKEAKWLDFYYNSLIEKRV